MIDARTQACDFSCDAVQCILACPTGSLTYRKPPFLGVRDGAKLAADANAAADAAAAALAEGMSPADIGEAITLAANQLVLRDMGRHDLIHQHDDGLLMPGTAGDLFSVKAKGGDVALVHAQRHLRVDRRRAADAAAGEECERLAARELREAERPEEVVGRLRLEAREVRHHREGDEILRQVLDVAEGAAEQVHHLVRRHPEPAADHLQLVARGRRHLAPAHRRARRRRARRARQGFFFRRAHGGQHARPEGERGVGDLGDVV